MSDDLPARSDLEYVGFWIRAVAVVVDTVLLALLMTPVGWFVFGTFDANVDGRVPETSNFIVSVVLPAIVVIVFWSRRQSTPGKMLFGARIVDAKTGEPPDAGQWAMRYIGYYLSAFGLFLGFVRAAFDPRKQGWHDKLAGTVVVRTRPIPGDPLGIDRRVSR